MKKLAFALVLAVFGQASAVAQNQPEVDVLKFGWRKLAHKTIPSGKDAQKMRNAHRDAQIAEEYRKQPQERDYGAIIRLQREKANQVTPLDRPDPTDKAYEYKFRFKNRGTKEIASLGWFYVFRDPDTQKELAAHYFNTSARIKPGKETALTAYANAGPPMIVSAKEQAQKGKPWVEEVRIDRVVYADGSEWERE